MSMSARDLLAGLMSQRSFSLVNSRSHLQNGAEQMNAAVRVCFALEEPFVVVEQLSACKTGNSQRQSAFIRKSDQRAPSHSQLVRRPCPHLMFAL